MSKEQLRVFDNFSTKFVVTINNSAFSEFCTILYERTGLKHTAWLLGKVHGVVVHTKAYTL